MDDLSVTLLAAAGILILLIPSAVILYRVPLRLALSVASDDGGWRGGLHASWLVFGGGVVLSGETAAIVLTLGGHRIARIPFPPPWKDKGDGPGGWEDRGIAEDAPGGREARHDPEGREGTGAPAGREAQGAPGRGEGSGTLKGRDGTDVPEAGIPRGLPEDREGTGAPEGDISPARFLQLLLSLAGPGRDLLRAWFSRLRFESLSGSIRVGLADPSQTGLLYGMYWAVRSILPSDRVAIAMVPVFDREMFGMHITGRIRIDRPAGLVGSAFRFFANPAIWRLIRMGRTGNDKRRRAGRTRSRRPAGA
jgi:hypothetical protein